MKNLFLILLLFYYGQSQAQIIETNKINDTRTYEVTATLLPDHKIVAVWMEARPKRVISEQADDMQVAYAISDDLGATWSNKKIIDKPNTLLTVNPNVFSDKQGNTYLVAMHVGEDIFSGELAIYTFSPKLNEFELKSIPIQSDSSLLDKPSITENNDKMFLSYTEVTRKLKNSFLHVLRSNDHGKTWKNIPSMTKDSLLYMGTSAIASSNHLILSTGTYGNESIEFFDYNLKTHKIKRTKVAGISDQLEDALSEMVDHGDNLCINWYNNHAPNEVYFALSRNRGKSWNNPILVSKNGNLLSTVFDEDENLVVLYSEFDNNKFSVIVKHYNTSENRFLDKFYLKEPTVIKDKLDYIGAFQKIIRLEDNRFIAFCIDFSDNNKLYMSKWDTQE